MHVNKYIPPYMIFLPLKSHTLNMFSYDYANDEADITTLMIEFDKKLVNTFNARKERFSHYLLDLDFNEREGGGLEKDNIDERILEQDEESA